MVPSDKILDSTRMPSFSEISEYIRGSTQRLWRELNSYVQHEFQVSPRITYSKCAAKPGWNVKYQKSGKSLFTLYPERDGFVALVVITLDRVPLIESMSDELEPQILDLVRTAEPFNGTLWLMIQVANEHIAKNVQQLLALKQQAKQRARAVGIPRRA